MSRIIFWGAIAGLAILIFKKKRASSNHSVNDALPLDEHDQSQLMVQCTKCGLHVPPSQVVTRDKKPYCCKAHANEH